MYKYLVVGCGGSGGAALAYMMDQITSELVAHGIDSMPAGLQFVHVDVPVAPDTKLPGIGDVRAQGGRYIGTAPSSGSYPVLDNAVSTTLGQRRALGDIATWASRRPSEIAVPIAYGAGQMRAVGRMITLSRAAAVYDGLQRAWDALHTVEANSQMAAAARALPGAGRFDAGAPPIVLVVSSMAGGAGASMTLDVCRMLTNIPQVDPELIALFLAAPDVFDSLPDHARSGVRANALAMLGEIVAAQTGAAEPHDRELLTALGQQVPPTGRAPFKRVFPIGRFVGTQRTLFGDGTQNAVYRGLGRGLAALALSEQASSQFVSYDLTNKGPDADQNVFGWGANPSDFPWGAFGFGSLSLGRDRYRHYAAQRLARNAVDRLVRGHLQPHSDASGLVQLRGLLDSQYATIAGAAGLPTQAVQGVLTREELGAWMLGTALPRADVLSDVRQLVDSLVRPLVSQFNGPVQPWLVAVRSSFAAQRAALLGGLERDSYRWAHDWADRLHDGVVAQTESAAARFGLPFARALVERMQSAISDQLVPALRERAGMESQDPGQVPQSFEVEAARLKGSVANSQQLVDRLLALVSDGLVSGRYGRSARIAASVLESFVSEALAPLISSLSDAIEVLELAAAPAPGALATGLANVETDRYAAWPSDGDAEVPERFGVADNDILLTPFQEFADRFVEHLPPAVHSEGASSTLDEARGTAARLVISGRWKVASGSQAPGGLLTVPSRWRASTFTRDPETNEPEQPSRARYAWHTEPGDLLDRAQAFVRRPNESFDAYCSQSLAAYVAGADASPAERTQRITDLVDRFGQAVARALPLISVNADAVRAVHQEDIQYHFKFSTVPFGDAPEIAAALRSHLGAMKDVSSDVVGELGTFDRALAKDTSVNRIDIFGSYQNYSPVVFDALLRPVATQWAATPQFGRHGFWQLRRSRPLPASLPMTDEERRAMIGGWYVGQLTGRLRIPESPFTDPVRVWDDARGLWADFPNPLLTPPSEFLGRTFDWLPAVLESVLLAVSRSHETPVMSSMRPYQLLRAMWDETEGRPASGMFGLSAERELAAWLDTGRTRSGAPSRIDAPTKQERFDLAQQWVRTIHDFTVANFLPPESSAAAGTGEFARITSREQAGRTPIFRDLADDIRLVTEQLQNVLESARTAQAAGPATEAAVPPGFGAF